MRHSKHTYASLMLASCAYILGVCKGGWNDTNATDALVGSVDCGETVYGSIESYDINLYSFYLLEDEDVVVLDTCNSSYDTWLYLYDEYGYELSSCDDCGDCGVRTILTLYNVDAGLYYIGVGGFGSNSGDYKLSVSCYNDNSTYTSYSTSSGGGGSGTINSYETWACNHWGTAPMPVDCFYDGSAGITIECTSSGDEAEINFYDTTDCSGTPYTTWTWDISTFDGQVDCSYDYSCDYYYYEVYNDTTSDDNDCDGDLAFSNGLVINECYTSTSSSSFRTMCDDDGEITIYYYDCAYCYCGADNFTSTNIYDQYNQCVDFECGVNGTDSATSSPSDLEVVGSIECNDLVNGDIDEYEIDVYSFNVTESYATIQLSTCGSDYDTYLYIYDEDGNTINSCDDCGDCGTRTIITTSLDVGFYYVGVGGFSDDYGDYILDIQCGNFSNSSGGGSGSSSDAYSTWECNHFDLYPLPLCLYTGGSTFVGVQCINDTTFTINYYDSSENDCSGSAISSETYDTSIFDNIDCSYDDLCDSYSFSIYNDSDCSDGNLMTSASVVVNECYTYSSYSYQTTCNDNGNVTVSYYYDCNDCDCTPSTSYSSSVLSSYSDDYCGTFECDDGGDSGPETSGIDPSSSPDPSDDSNTESDDGSHNFIGSSFNLMVLLFFCYLANFC